MSVVRRALNQWETRVLTDALTSLRSALMNGASPNRDVPDDVLVIDGLLPLLRREAINYALELVRQDCRDADDECFGTIVHERCQRHADCEDPAPADGVDRCECGCKYWDGWRCIDCGERFVAVTS